MLKQDFHYCTITLAPIQRLRRRRLAVKHNQCYAKTGTHANNTGHQQLCRTQSQAEHIPVQALLETIGPASLIPTSEGRFRIVSRKESSERRLGSSVDLMRRENRMNVARPRHTQRQIQTSWTTGTKPDHPGVRSRSSTSSRLDSRRKSMSQVSMRPHRRRVQGDQPGR